VSYPRHRLARAHKFFHRSAGNLTLASSTWADLPTIGTTWDAVLAAQGGDTIEAGISGVLGSENVQMHFDACTVVAGTVVNYFASGTASGAGTLAWLGEGAHTTNIGGSAMRTLVAGDLSAGTVTLRLRYRGSSATSRTLYASSDLWFHFWVKNIGPVDAT
jgi:hypothetical protein